MGMIGIKTRIQLGLGERDGAHAACTRKAFTGSRQMGARRSQARVSSEEIGWGSILLHDHDYVLKWQIECHVGLSGCQRSSK
jgi:hypothetical protein